MVARLILVCLLLSGCTLTAKTEDPRAVWCEQNEPRRDQPKTRAEKEAFAIHNAKGAAWCGWVP